MAHLKRSLIIFISTFLLCVICGSVLHNLFTSTRLQTLVAKILSESAPGMRWTVHRVQVELSDGLLPIVALSIGEVLGERLDVCDNNISLNIRDVFLPLDMTSLILGPVRLGKIRFREMMANEIPKVLQSCKNQNGSVVFKNGEVYIKDKVYEFKGVFEPSPELLRGEVIPPLTLSGTYIDEVEKRIDFEILWRESKINGNYNVSTETVDIKATKLPSFEIIKVLKGLGVHPIPTNLGPNWIELSAQYTRARPDGLKINEIAVSGDIGDISASGIDVQLNQTLRFAPFQMTLKKVSISEVSKMFEFESFPRFFKNPGRISGTFVYGSDAQKFYGDILDVDIEVSNQGRKNYFRILKTNLDVTYKNSQFESFIKDFEIKNGKAKGLVHVVFAKKNAHTDFKFTTVQLDPSVLEHLLAMRMQNASMEGQIEIIDSKIKSLSARSKITGLEGKGFKADAIQASATFNTNTPGTLFFEMPQVTVVPTSDAPEVLHKIHATIEDSREWINIRGQLTGTDGEIRLRTMKFEYPNHAISILPDKNNLEVLNIWDTKKKKSLGTIPAKL